MASPSTGAAKQFHIYTNHYRVKRVKTLSHIYPICEKLVGPLFFRKMIDDYLEKRPSLSYSLNDYGSDLADYLKNDQPLLALLPYIIDMLQLEWHIHSLLTCLDEPVFDWQILKTLSSDRYLQLQFYRSKASCLMRSFFPVDIIFDINQSDEPSEDSLTLNAPKEPFFFLIQRVQWHIKIHRLTEKEYDLLKQLDGKKTVEAVAKAVSVSTLKDTLPRLIQKGYVTGFG